MSAKILMLDLRWRGHESLNSEFVRMCEEQFGCEVLEIEPVPNDGRPTEEVESWARTTDSLIDDAEIFVWLGSTLLFEYSGSYGDSFATRIIEKIQMGTPILLQCQNWKSEIRQSFAPLHSIEAILKCLAVHPTDIAVVSRIHRDEGQKHDYNCHFTKSFGVIRDPRLFRDVSKLDASSPTLLIYDDEMLPLVEVSYPEYEAIDKRTDLVWVGELGIHKCIASSSYLYDSVQLVFAAELFSDRRKSGMGLDFPNIENNRRLTENIIEELISFAKTSKKYQLETYRVFDALERDMGKILRFSVGDERIIETLPELVRSNLTRYSKAPDMSQATFNDIGKIILHHWTVIGDFFPEISRRDMKSKLYQLNSGNRRYLAHPDKAERNFIEFTFEDVEEMRELRTIFSRALTLAIPA
ncbi:MAG: hypothetical protein V7720_00655 [Halioglobus sp.]